MSGLAALRRFAVTPPPATPITAPEKCELCAAPLAGEHDHLLEGSRRLVCACGACARLFPGKTSAPRGEGEGGARYRFVARRASRLALVLPEALWNRLDVPIGVAFFVPGANGSARAIYPGAAGAVEAPVPREGWAALVAACPVAGELEPDVEALLVDRTGEEPRTFRVSIDLAFELAGILRRTWRGISGGEAARGGLEEFLSRLDAPGEAPSCPS